MSRTVVRWSFLAVLAAMVVLASGVLVANAATKPTKLAFACGSKSTGGLRYVSKASACKNATETVVDFSKDFVKTCVKQHGHRRGADAPKYRRLPAGSTRMVGSLSLCAPHYQPNEKPMTLPGKDKSWFCALKSNGRLRWVIRKPKCTRSEFVAYLNGRTDIGGGGNPAGPGNVAPVANGDSAPTDEDTARRLSVLGNDTDADGDALKVAAVDTTGTKGTAVANADGTVTYDPNGTFESLKPGQTATDSFKYKANDGTVDSAAATVTVTITGVNDAPVGVEDAPTTSEAAAKTFSVVGNDTDAEGDALTIGSVDIGGTIGKVTPHSDGTLTYDPNGKFEDLGTNESRQDIFKYKANDGSVDSAPTTVVVTVTGINDAPTVTTTSSTLAYAENDAPKAVDTGLTVGDLDGDQIHGATARITAGHASPEDVLAFTPQSGITGSYNSGTGTLTLTGNASAAAYQAALRSVTYENTSDNPSTTTRTVSFKVTDVDLADSTAATRDVSVSPTNDAPVVTPSGGSTAFTENGSPVAIDVAVGVSDPDDANIESGQVQISSGFQAGDDLIFVDQNGISGTYSAGTGVLNLTTTSGASKADWETALRSIEFDSTVDNPPTSKTIEFKVNDGGVDSSAATKDIAIAQVNDDPVNAVPGAQGTNEDTDLTITGLGVSDPDSGTADIQTVVGVDHGTLKLSSTAGLTSVTGDNTGTVTLTGPAAAVNTDLANLVYSPSANYNGSDTLDVATTDQGNTGTGGARTDHDTVGITVNAVNDGPVNTVPGAQTLIEDGSKTFSSANSNAISIADVDANPDSVSVDLKVTDGTLTLGSTASLTVTGNGTDHVKLEGTQSAVNTGLDGLVYAPDHDFFGNDTLTVKTDDLGHNGSGGAIDATSTVGLTVTAVNDAPVLTASGSFTYTENDPATAVAPALAASDVDSTNLVSATVQVTGNYVTGEDVLSYTDTAAITGAWNGATGTLTLTPTSTATVAQFEASLQAVKYANTSDDPNTAQRTVSFQVDDGASANNLSNVPTRKIDVTAVSDAPVVTTSAGSTAYTEGDPAALVDGALTVSDTDSTQLQSAQVEISAATFHTGDVLTFTASGAVTGSYSPATHILSLSGTDSVATYQTVLKSVTFENTTSSPTNVTRHIVFRASDGSATSADAAKDVTVSEVNSKPVVTTSGGSASFVEDSGAVAVDSGIDVTDGDSSNLVGATVQITGNHQNGEDTLTFANTANITGNFTAADGKLTLSGSDTVANYKAALASVKFDDSSDTPSTATRTVTIQVDDGSSVNNLSALQTRDVAVTATNDKPVVTPSAAATPTFTEDGAAVTVDSGITVADVDSLTLSGATVSITTNFSSANGDTLTFTPQGTITGSYAPATGVLTLSGSGTQTEYGAVLQSVNYSNTSQNPSTAARTISFVANDGAAFNNLSTAATRTVNVVSVNDSPVLTQPDSAELNYVEDSPTENHADAIAPNLTVADGDDANLTGATVTINGNPQPEDQLLFTNQNGITATGDGTTTLNLSGTATVAQYEAALRSVKYRNPNEDPSSATRTVSFQVTDGHTGENPLSNVVSRNIHVEPVNDAPVADDETFNGAASAVGNTTFVGNDPSDGAPATPDPTDTSPVTDRPHKAVSGDILAGDTDADGPGPLTVTPGTFATNDGGTVTLESDGDFTFEPAPSTSCTDTSDFFDYTVEDSGSPEQTDTGRVTIAILGCVRYVNNDDAQGNSGTSEKPFDTLAQAETASAAGDSIFVYAGNDTSSGYTSGIDLKSGQKLLGEAATLTVGSDTLHSADAANRPTITDNNADVVSLDDGNDVRGLDIDPQGTGGGIAGAAGDTGGGTIGDVRIIDTATAGTQPGLELDGTTGTFNISDLTIDNSAATGATSGSIGVRLNNAGTVNFLSSGTISITTNGAKGLDATSTGMGAGSVFDDITVTGSGSGGVSMASTTGSTTLGNGSGTDLNLTTTSGSTPAFALSTAGTVSVGAPGIADVHATGGPAIDVTGTSGATLNFDDVDSTNSASDGINIDGLGTGTFSATGGDIAGYAGTGFDLNGGSGAITYAGNLNNGLGATADVTGRTGGAVSLSGSINDSNDTGGGITLSGNSGGSTTFSGPTKTLNTGAGNAITVSQPDSSTHTVTSSGGGLNIDTTSGKGLEATGVGAVPDGTINVTGSGNTIDTTTGTALNVASTTIGASGTTFQSISSNGAANGIVLNNTGSTGSLTVTGTGGANSGGTIQNSTGAGVSLSSVTAPSLASMSITAGGDDGITGSNVNGLTLATSSVTSNGNAQNESGLDFSNLTGTVALTSDNVSFNGDSNVRITNDSGTLNATVSGAGSAYSGSGTVVGAAGDGIFVEGTNTGAQNLTIQGTLANPIVFANNKDSHVQHTSDSANTTDSNVTVDNANLSEPAGGGTALGGGITINHGGNSNVDATLTNNNIQNSVIGAIAVDTTGSVADQQQAFIDATIQNNTIGTAGVAGSGSTQGNGIFVSSNGAGHVRALITNNNVRQWTNRNGLELDVLDGPAQLDATVRGNTFTEPNSAFAGTTTRGFTFQLGAAQAGDNIQACLDVGDPGNTSLKNQVFGTGESPQPDIRYLYEGPSSGGPSQVKLANYGGPSSPALTDIANYFKPRNDTGGTPTVTGTPAPTGANSTTSVASCPLPAP